MFGLYNNNLPEILSIEEEKKLIESNDNDSKKILIERNLRLVVDIAKKFISPGESIEDLTSIGTIGLIKGVNTFDPQNNILLATYVSKCIKNEILKHLKKCKKIRKEVSLDKIISSDKNKKIFLIWIYTVNLIV